MSARVGRPFFIAGDRLREYFLALASLFCLSAQRLARSMCREIVPQGSDGTGQVTPRHPMGFERVS